MKEYDPMRGDPCNRPRMKSNSKEHRAKENILELGKILNRRIRVEMSGGRTGMMKIIIFSIMLTAIIVEGVLKGFDQLNNLVLDDTKEIKGMNESEYFS